MTEQGAPRPPVPPENEAGAYAAPVPRQQGHRPCTLPAMEETYRTYFFPHETSGNGKRAHGRNENVEKSRSGKYTFLPVFSHFHRMQSIRLAVFHRPARGRAPVAHPARKETIYLCKGVSACSSAAANSQRFNRFLAKMCVRFTLFHRDVVCVLKIAASGSGSRGDAPCGVQRRSPAGLPNHHRDIVCII